MDVVKYVEETKELIPSENPKFAVTNLVFDYDNYRGEDLVFVKSHDFEIPEKIKDNPKNIKEFLEHALLESIGFDCVIKGVDVYNGREGDIIHKQMRTIGRFDVFDLINRVPLNDGAIVSVYKDKVYISYEIDDEDELFNILDLERVKNGEVELDEVVPNFYIDNMMQKDVEALSDEEYNIITSADFKFEPVSDEKIENFRVKEKPELIEGQGNQYNNDTYDEYERE